MPRFPYRFFDNFVIRRPLFSYKKFQKIFSEKNTNDEELIENLTEGIFREAIYLASPLLELELRKYLNIHSWLAKDQQYKLKNTLLKYYARISARSTPFGLFAGVGLGQFSSETDFPIRFSGLKIRNTKPDMHFLVLLKEQLLSVPDIRNKILFFPNNSIYRIGNKIRYIEYEYRGNIRDYIISCAPVSIELERILNFIVKGKTINQLTGLLVDDSVSAEQAADYIDELIKNQVLVSELEPNLTGTDYLESIIYILDRIGAKKEKDILTFIKNEINKLDFNFENPISAYSRIEELIKATGAKYEQKYLFQTDLYINENVRISYHWKKELKKGISLINKISQLNKNTHIEIFKNAFYERFENEEIPLSFALDTEVGIGYRQDVEAAGVHPYLDDLVLPSSVEKAAKEIRLTPVQILLNQKLQNIGSVKEYIITLSDEDFVDFEEYWDDLPETLYFMGEIFSDNNLEKMYLHNGSSNAGRLLARFSSEKSSVQELVKEIANKEQEFSKDKILAEIIHLPQSRTGNILRRPQLRNYEIPYLAKSLLPDEYQITIDDLYISIKNDRLVLRSKKHNKEVKPLLTNAHNYSANTLPVYHFLCDLSSQNLKSGLYFDWGGLNEIYDFLPRIEYENIILSKAKWKIRSFEMKRFYSLLYDDELLVEAINEWRNQKLIPRWICWVQSDNTLVVNLENLDLLHMFFSTVKNESEIVIEEFLCNDNDDFNYEFIFPLYKSSN